MRILIIHQNFPGQFRHLAHAWLRKPGVQLMGMGRERAPGLPGFPCIKYTPHRFRSKNQHHYLRKMEDAVLHGQATARRLLDLKKKDAAPDVILAHPGWGETLYVKDVFPDVRLIHLCEWYYHFATGDVGFDPEFSSSFDDAARIRTWNALHTLNLENCDQGVSPTIWQKQRHPAAYQERIAVVHEGIDSDLSPDPEATFTTPSGVLLRVGDPVITYVARNLEPYRGFHSFMRTLEVIQRRHKRCHAVIVGGDEVSYGKPPVGAATWREKMLQEVTLDPARTHFTGRIPNDSYRRLLQVSAAHIYLTYPFVLSWSLLEAMASGCLVIGSRTPPVEEVIRAGENGLLVDMFNREEIANCTLDALESPERFARLRQRARVEAMERFSREKGVEGYGELVGVA